MVKTVYSMATRAEWCGPPMPVKLVSVSCPCLVVLLVVTCPRCLPLVPSVVPLRVPSLVLARWADVVVSTMYVFL